MISYEDDILMTEDECLTIINNALDIFNIEVVFSGTFSSPYDNYYNIGSSDSSSDDDEPLNDWNT